MHPHFSGFRVAQCLALPGWAGCAAAALLALLPIDASAVPLFEVRAATRFNSGNAVGNCSPAPIVQQSGTTPAAAAVTCGDSNGAISAEASATFGHVGASSSAASTGSGLAAIESSAFFSDATFVFHANTPGVNAILISMNLAINGNVGSTELGGAGVAFALTINNQDAGRFRRDVSGGVEAFCINTFNSTGGCDVTSFLGVSQSALVPIDIPVTIGLSLQTNAGAGGAGQSASAEYGHSFDFPIGSDLFNLPDGVTVNNPEAFVFNNRFRPPGANEVPEPTSLALLCGGLAAFGFARRRRGQSTAEANR